ncbi:hypothetical protein E8E14_008256 [Neopestalotiopsis sp. 37M]|nr:hypothetical protein E8E14_008256 [Neopestalotiopsis sp. 37M]
MGVDVGVESTFIVPRNLFAPLYHHTAIHVYLVPSPESPRWLLHEEHYEDARLVVAQTNTSGDLSDPVAITICKHLCVQIFRESRPDELRTLDKEILDTLEWEKKEGRTMSPKEVIKTPVARKRMLIGASAGPFSCIAGNIIASYYLGSELETAGIVDTLSQLKANVVLNVWCLACSLLGTHLAARWGRKPTALLTQSLLVICLFIIGGLSKMYADDPEGASSSLIYGDVAVMFLFQGFYSIAWTPLLFLYPPEVMNYSIRANGVALSQLGLNAFAMVLVFVMPIGLDNIGWKMYMINGSWDIIVIFLIAIFWIETKGKSLEEIDALFEGQKHSSVPDVEKVRLGVETIDVSKVEHQIQADIEAVKTK